MKCFFIYSHFQEGTVSILFSSKNLLNNYTKQSQILPPFIHIDSTFKLIDLGLPLIIVSTETLNHNFRQIAFYVSWAESTEQVKLMLTKLSEFYQEKLNTEFKPKYIMTDNSDALIAGCKKFTHEYIHMGCHFHIYKRMKEKTQNNKL